MSACFHTMLRLSCDSELQESYHAISVSVLQHPGLLSIWWSILLDNKTLTPCLYQDSWMVWSCSFMTYSVWWHCGFRQAMQCDPTGLETVQQVSSPDFSVCWTASPYTAGRWFEVGRLSLPLSGLEALFIFRLLCRVWTERWKESA